jgi:membrane protein implicated in regulation of membrane protease activity
MQMTEITRVLTEFGQWIPTFGQWILTKAAQLKAEQLAAIVAVLSAIAAWRSARSARKNARIAEAAKEQLRQTTLLERRIEVINAVEQAREQLNRSDEIRSAAENLRKARKGSEFVFSFEVRQKLQRADNTVWDMFIRAREQLVPIIVDDALKNEIKALLERMNRETRLPGVR